MEVSVLVTQMHDTLSTIHRTLDSLNNTNHDEKLDELEQKREDNIQALFEAFTVESESLSQKRKAERDDIAERRRIEDEERERRRRLEDEDLAVRDTALDEEREERLKEDAIDIEEEVDGLMAQVEEEAQRTIEEGRERLRALEEKRKELNRLIDEQLQIPLPAVPNRARRGTRTGQMPPVVAVESKPSEPSRAVESVSNLDIKAREKNDAKRDDAASAEASRAHVTVAHEAFLNSASGGLMLKREVGATDAERKDPAPNLESPQARHDTAGIESHEPRDQHEAKAVSQTTSNTGHAVEALPKLNVDLAESPQTKQLQSLEIEGPSESNRVAIDEGQLSDSPMQLPNNNDEVSAESNSPFRLQDETTKAAVGSQLDHLVEESHQDVDERRRSNLQDGEEEAQASDSQSTSEKVTSSAREIPGTMNHWAEPEGPVTSMDSANSIPGTMTHGVDEPEVIREEEPPRGQELSLREPPEPLSAVDAGNGDAGVSTTPSTEASLEAVRSAPREYEEDLPPKEEPLIHIGQHIGNTQDLTHQAISDHNAVSPAYDSVLETKRYSIAEAKNNAAIDEQFVHENYNHQSRATLEHSVDDLGIRRPAPSRLDFGPSQENTSTTDHNPYSPQTESAEPVPSIDDFTVDDPYSHIVHSQATLHPTIVSPNNILSPHTPRNFLFQMGGILPVMSGWTTPAEHESGAQFSEEQQPPRLSLPGSPILQNSIAGNFGLGDNSTDTESQVFVTPLASAGFRSPGILERQGTLADEPDHVNDVTEQPEEDRLYQGDNSSQYELEDVHTTTVHGEDDLFDYDDQSDGSAGSRASANREPQNDGSSHGMPADNMKPIRPPALEPIIDVMIEQDEDEPRTAVPATDLQADFSSHLKNDWADDVEGSLDESSNSAAGLATPPLQSIHTPATDVSPLEQRSEVSSAQKGLAASRHNPQRPQTPEQHSREASQESEADDFMPRDVTNLPWHVRNGSTPQSMRSQSTLSSAPSSPAHGSLDNHEPAIHHSWQAGPHGRSRGDSQLTEYSQFGAHESPNTKTAPAHFAQWNRRESISHTTPTAPTASSFTESTRSRQGSVGSSNGGSTHTANSTGSLFQRMRNVFEQSQSTIATTASNGTGTSRGRAPSLSDSLTWSAGKGSPARSRPVSGLLHPNTSTVGPAKGAAAAAAARGSHRDAADEADDESDERSSLLNHGADEGAN